MRYSVVTAAVVAGGVLGLAWLGTGGAVVGQEAKSDAKDKDKVAAAVGAAPAVKKFEDFAKVTEGAKEYEGLFKLYQKDDHVYAEIKPDQFEKPLLCPIAIARGMAMGGYTLNFDGQWVLMFRRVGDKVQVLRRNVRFQAKKGSPLARAVETTYTDSVLLAVKIKTINPARQGVVIDLNDIFMTDFAQLGLGAMDPNRSTWHKVKAFPKNIELEVAATYTGSRFFGVAGGGNSVVDPRGNTLVIHYGLAQLPDDGYQPRLADDRVGHFLSVVKDYSVDTQDTSFVRYVNRWRLERAVTDAKQKEKLSPPKKKIVFWIENSVPDEYRAYVREGILEWNKAFEKVGFRDAIEVRQQESEDFDPEDINYSTFRWITTSGAFAMGPSRANPLTGEILDADIIFDADMVRYWRQEHQILAGKGALVASQQWQRGEGAWPLELVEPASPIQAMRMGWGLVDWRLFGAGMGEGVQGSGFGGPGADALAAGPAGQLWAVRQGVCQFGAGMKSELGLLAMEMQAAGMVAPGEKVPDELLGQAIKEVTMHEVGHTLGLRHNFKASVMLKNEQLHDTSLTRSKGLVASVMDYSPVNLAPKGTKQGDYFTTTLGLYDYWAIEYAYKPLGGGTEGEYDKLAEVAGKVATPGLDYGTDEDMFGTADPLVNAFDLGSDPMKFGQERMLLAEELMKGLADRVVEKGEGYQRARRAFGMLMNQYGNAAYLTSNFVGGEYAHRDHRGDAGGREPFVPVKAAQQREAMKFLQEHILSDRSFQFSPELLKRLAADRWWHWGNEAAAFSSVDYPVYERILAIQRVVLGHMLSGSVLARIENSALKAEKGEGPLTLAEMFRSLTDGIWGEVPAGAAKPEEKRKVEVSTIRRNLQREYVRQVANLVLGPRSSSDSFGVVIVGLGSGSSAPADARSLGRMHLRQIEGRIGGVLEDKQVAMDDTTRAHLEECKERIGKVLGASMQISDR